MLVKRDQHCEWLCHTATNVLGVNVHVLAVVGERLVVLLFTQTMPTSTRNN